MPFIIATRTPECSDRNHDGVTRRAVAGPEEARGVVRDMVRRHGVQPGAFHAEVARIMYGNWRSEEPLPDGTVVAVEAVSWTKLAEDDRRSAKWAERGLFGAQDRIVAAYNAKQEAAHAL